MAEALLRARLADVDPSIEVASAGLLFDGRPAERAISLVGVPGSVSNDQAMRSPPGAVTIRWVCAGR